MQNYFCTTLQPLRSWLQHFARLLLFFVLVSSTQAADIDIDKLLITAKKQNKHLLFFHHIPGCPYCKAMLDENFKDEKLLKEISTNFIHVEIYTANEERVKFQDFEGSTKEFSDHLGAFVYPSTIFMNSDGKIIHSAIGYRNVDEHFADISYVSTGSYQTMDLEAYKLKLELEDF